MIKFMLPCILISIISLIITSLYYYFSMKNEYNMLKKIAPLYRSKNEKQTKNGKVILITRVAILTISICFIIIGICNGQMGEVLSKAAKLCTECIGLG